MDRAELEHEVFKRLSVKNEAEAEIIKRALKLKPTAQIEDILERMKKTEVIK